MNIQSHAEHTAHACAANLWNVLPGIFKLPCVEGFERLVLHFENAIELFSRGRSFGRVPEPSEN
jgi:hypothetical protein